MTPTLPTPDSRALRLRDVPYGWITDIPANVTIHKARAVKMYLLKSRDLDGVPFNDRLIELPGHSYYCNEYMERDVEWKAWQIHGGPIQYWHFLKRQLRAGKRFPCTIFPYSYRRGARYDLSLATPPELQGRYVCDSIALRDAKLALPTWIWNACNVVLDGVFLRGWIPLSAKDLSSDRENAMKLAVAFFRTRHRRYAGRSNETLESSSCMIQLRYVLSDAPIVPKPGSREWGTAVEGLDFIRAGAREYYDWNAEYLERVFAAACEVAKVLGPHAQGWASARWEVYDKYSQLPGLGLHYDRATKTWSDPAADWLDRDLIDNLQGHLRGRCASGIAFNQLLPAPIARSSASSSSSQHPTHAGPSIISPTRTPPAARSSA